MCYSELNCQPTCKCCEQIECIQIQKMTTDGALWKQYFLTNKILAPRQIELSLEHFKEAFNTIVWKHLTKLLHTVLCNHTLEVDVG